MRQIVKFDTPANPTHTAYGITRKAANRSTKQLVPATFASRHLQTLRYFRIIRIKGI